LFRELPIFLLVNILDSIQNAASTHQLKHKLSELIAKGRTHADRHMDNTTRCLHTATRETELLRMNKTCRSDSSLCFRQL